MKQNPFEPQTREACTVDARASPARVRICLSRRGCSSRRRPPQEGRLPLFGIARRLHRRRRRAPLATVRARRLPRRQPPPRVLVARPWRGKGGVKFHSHGEDTQGRREIPLGMVKMIAGIGRDIQPNRALIEGRPENAILLFRSRQFRFCKYWTKTTVRENGDISPLFQPYAEGMGRKTPPLGL